MRVLQLAPWWRGPALLARRPGVALALFAAALVAALPAAAAPLFLSASQHATLHRQIAETCPWVVGGQFTGPLAPGDTLNFRGGLGPDSIVGAERFRQREAAVAAHPVSGLTAPVSAAYGDVNIRPIGRDLPNPDLPGIRLLTRTGFAAQVEVLAGPVGEGIWLPHEYARQQAIEVGDELELTFRGDENNAKGTWTPPAIPNRVDRPLQRGPEREVPEPAPITVPVAAIYRDLNTLPESAAWCGVAHGYLGTPAERANDNISILPMALADADLFLRIGETTLIRAEHYVELALVDPQLTAPEAAALSAEVAALRATMFSEYPDLFPASFSDRSEFHSLLDRYQRRAALVRTGLLPPVLPITAAGTLVGLAVAGAAAVFWVQRRRGELTVLAAHGVGPRALGLKALLEALPAAAAGTAAGWATAWGLVAAVGPSPVLEPGALPTAALAAAVVGLVALLLIAGLATARGRALTDTAPVTRRAGRWRRLPWELTLVAAAPLAWLLLTSGQVIDEEAGGVGAVAHVPARLLVTPILAIVGTTIFAGRLATLWLNRRGLARAPASPARLLAWRRSIRTAMATSILAIATAIPVAMATFGATATDSISTTADAKLKFGLGSDTIVTYPRGSIRDLDNLPPPPSPPDSLADRATEVLRLNQQRVDGLLVDVLAVDPHTFTAGAFWDRRIPGASLQDAVDQLRADGPATVVASRRIPPGSAVLHIRDAEIPVTVAATRPLPGAQGAYPMVLVHRGLVERLDQRSQDSFTPQWWVAGEPAETLAVLTASELPAARVSTVDDHRAGAVYEPVTYTFQYLMALSVFTGLIGAVGLLLYLESRTASHRRAYVMLRRLGLPARSHRNALLLEIGVPVATGLLVGLAGALGVAYALRTGFDVNPRRFPAAVLELPMTATTLIGAAALALAVGASILAHRRIARANPAEVLRDTV